MALIVIVCSFLGCIWAPILVWYQYQVLLLYRKDGMGESARMRAATVGYSGSSTSSETATVIGHYDDDDEGDDDPFMGETSPNKASFKWIFDERSTNSFSRPSLSIYTPLDCATVSTFWLLRIHFPALKPTRDSSTTCTIQAKRNKLDNYTHKVRHNPLRNRTLRASFKGLQHVRFAYSYVAWVHV